MTRASKMRYVPIFLFLLAVIGALAVMSIFVEQLVKHNPGENNQAPESAAMAHPKYDGPCKIYHWGYDGLGHQIDGRIGMILLEYMEPKKLEYKNRPFHAMQHSRIPMETINRVFGTSSDETKGARTNLHMQKASAHVDTGAWMRGKIACEDRTILDGYDNVWEILFNDPYVSRINDALANSPKIRELRERLKSAPELTFSPAFEKSVANVVIQVRSGDARGTRGSAGSYFVHAMQEMRRRIKGKPIVFHVETDDWNWDGIKEIERENGKALPRPGDNGDVLKAFGRLLAADAIIGSNSSVSWVSLMLRDTFEYPSIVPDDTRVRFRRNWIAASPTKMIAIR